LARKVIPAKAGISRSTTDIAPLQRPQILPLKQQHPPNTKRDGAIRYVENGTEKDVGVAAFPGEPLGISARKDGEIEHVNNTTLKER